MPCKNYKIFKLFNKIPRVDPDKYDKYACKYCDWRVAKNSTRMVKHIRKCRFVPKKIKEYLHSREYQKKSPLKEALTDAQKNKLFEFVEDIVKINDLKDLKRLDVWDDVTEEINKLGGEKKTTKQIEKYWSCMKQDAENKLIIKQMFETRGTGRDIVLTADDKRILSIKEINCTVAGDDIDSDLDWSNDQDDDSSSISMATPKHLNDSENESTRLDPLELKIERVYSDHDEHDEIQITHQLPETDRKMDKKILNVTAQKLKIERVYEDHDEHNEIQITHQLPETDRKMDKKILNVTAQNNSSNLLVNELNKSETRNYTIDEDDSITLFCRSVAVDIKKMLPSEQRRVKFEIQKILLDATYIE